MDIKYLIEDNSSFKDKVLKTIELGYPTRSWWEDPSKLYGLASDEIYLKLLLERKKEVKEFETSAVNSVFKKHIKSSFYRGVTNKNILHATVQSSNNPIDDSNNGDAFVFTSAL